MEDVANKIAKVTNQQTLAEFVAEVADDYMKSGQNWENNDLQRFLYALAAWIEDMDGYYRNTGLPYDEKNITWKNFADMIWAATMYE